MMIWHGKTSLVYIAKVIICVSVVAEVNKCNSVVYTAFKMKKSIDYVSVFRVLAFYVLPISLLQFMYKNVFF